MRDGLPTLGHAPPRAPARPDRRGGDPRPGRRRPGAGRLVRGLLGRARPALPPVPGGPGRTPRRVAPDPPPPGLPPVHALAAYEGVVRAVLGAHKEGGRLGLAGPLGDALAQVVSSAVCRVGGRACRVVLVPVPSRPGSARRRGHDPLVRTARRAAARLRRTDAPAGVVPALTHRRAVVDQAGLDHLERQANLAGALALRPGAGALLRDAVVVVVDDVMTTGATLAEAARALAAAGAAPEAAAVVAATRRRSSRPGCPMPR